MDSIPRAGKSDLKKSREGREETRRPGNFRFAFFAVFARNKLSIAPRNCMFCPCDKEPSAAQK